MSEAVSGRRLFLPAAFFALLCGGSWLWAQEVELELTNPTWVLGWLLTGTIALPSLYNLRKRLIAFNMGPASFWLAMHVASGSAAVILYFLHTGVFWPEGGYERLIAVLFATITLTGFAGLWAQLVLPRRLTETGQEYVYEKIPAEIADLRDAARRVVIEYTENTGSELLSQHYEKSLDWYFTRPRFFWNIILGGNAAGAWSKVQIAAIRRFSDPSQKKVIEKLEKLILTKIVVDRHYACQGILKRWLLAHVPLSAAFLITVAWHITLVHVYAL